METSGHKSRFSSILMVTSLGLAAYFAYTYFTKPDATRPRAPSVQTQTPVVPTPHAGFDGPSATPAPGQETALDSDLARRRVRTQKIVTLETSSFTATISDLNTGVTSFRPKDEKFGRTHGREIDLVTTDKERYFPLRPILTGVTVPPDARWALESSTPTSARFTWEGDGFRVVRKWEAGRGPYQLWSTIEIQNTGSAPRPMRLTLATDHYVRQSEAKTGIFAARSPAISRTLCARDDSSSVSRVDEGTKDGRAFADDFVGHGFGPAVRFAGIENTYFVNAVSADGAVAERCQLLTSERRAPGAADPDGTLYEARLVFPRAEVAPGATVVYRALAYIGPKVDDALHAAGHGLPSAIDLGWFAKIARVLVQLLKGIYDVVGNWGIAIIILTFVVRIAFLPLTMKSFQSMARMQSLKPEMDRINELYANDREKKGAAVMELYRKHKINPLGGCLPQLLQMPVWFAFYASLSTNIELYHAPFALWWTDLSGPDPYFVLPLVLGALMFVQQKITPTTMDPVQAKMMLYFMPIMMMSFMLFLPAGLCLYMVTNSVLGIGQQQWIIRRGRKPGSGTEVLATHATGSPIEAGSLAGDGLANRSQSKSNPSKRRNRGRE